MYEQIVAWWQKKDIQTDADLEEAFNGHVISFAYNSGNIENPNVTYHDTREIFEHDGVTSYTGDIRTLFEIRNAKLANEYFFAAFNEHKPVDEDLIKEIQKRLTLNTYDPLRWKKGERPGEYKKGDYVTGKNETGAWPRRKAGFVSVSTPRMSHVSRYSTARSASYSFNMTLILWGYSTNGRALIVALSNLLYIVFFIPNI